MDWDSEKIDEAVLGLLHLTLHDGNRAWKDFDWDALNRLHAKGLIEDPKNKNKSVSLTPEGLDAARTVAEERFGAAEAHTCRVLKSSPDTECRSADGLKGVLCRNAIDRAWFFRIYRADGTFEDYDLAHDELSVRVDNDAMAGLYRRPE